jgi:hypothetical protein
MVELYHHLPTCLHGIVHFNLYKNIDLIQSKADEGWRYGKVTDVPGAAENEAH